MSQFLGTYERPQNANRFLQKLGDTTILRFLRPPVFGWQDIAFEKDADGKSKKVIEDYWKFPDPATGSTKRPEITARPDLLDNLSKKPRKARHFWGCLVYNQEEKAIQYWQLTQAGIIDGIIDQDKAGWDLLKNDLIITKKVTKTNGQEKTDYGVSVSPNSTPLPDSIEQELTQMDIDMERIYLHGDPFKRDGQQDIEPEQNDPAEVNNQAAPEIDEATLNEVGSNVQMPF